MGPLDPEFFTSDEMRAALTARDIGTVYRLLGRQDVSQRRIAHLTGQSQHLMALRAARSAVKMGSPAVRRVGGGAGSLLVAR